MRSVDPAFLDVPFVWLRKLDGEEDRLIFCPRTRSSIALDPISAHRTYFGAEEFISPSQIEYDVPLTGLSERISMQAYTRGGRKLRVDIPFIKSDRIISRFGVFISV